MMLVKIKFSSSRLRCEEAKAFSVFSSFSGPEIPQSFSAAVPYGESVLAAELIL
jgi:hypothetical protein